MAATAEELAKQKAQARFTQHDFSYVYKNAMVFKSLQDMQVKYHDNKAVIAKLSEAQEEIERVNVRYNTKPYLANDLAGRRSEIAALETKRILIAAALAELDAEHLVIADPAESIEYKNMLKDALEETSNKLSMAYDSYHRLISRAEGLNLSSFREREDVAGLAISINLLRLLDFAPLAAHHASSLELVSEASAELSKGGEAAEITAEKQKLKRHTPE